ncbi:hypothetical protein IPA_00735 [Ignicoccus pacificus DSM 13166]|uniref:Isopentenyl phosphate kinase n=1 Tax=Ignicoccus pacificus DSM 13166 TaxID=940294 RepID=A0A977KBF0_9CREN|nr:hypothetical protein IPA_00735 [Ignicoccus pacificus DSM 13166]
MGGTMVVILKLGGSVISNKKVPYSLNEDYLKRLGESLRNFLKENPLDLIIIHGGGSYGHPKVKEILEGCKDLRSHGWEVVNTMFKMTARVVELMGEPFVAHSTPSLWVNGGIVVEPLVAALDAGWIPIIQGNLVPEGRVVSGDELAVELARKLRADRILMATDVPGIFKHWPPKEGEGPLKVVRACEVEAKGSEGIDVTGGMYKKLDELSRISKKVSVRVFDGTKIDNVIKALRGEEIGTLVLPC